MVEPAMNESRRRSLLDTVVPMRRQAEWLATLYEGEAELVGPAHRYSRRRWRNGLIAVYPLLGHFPLRPPTDEFVAARDVAAVDEEEGSISVVHNTEFCVLSRGEVAVEMRGGRHVAECNPAPLFARSVGRRPVDHVNVVQAHLAGL